MATSASGGLFWQMIYFSHRGIPGTHRSPSSWLSAPGNSCPGMLCWPRRGREEIRLPQRKASVINFSHASTAVVAPELLDGRGRGFERSVCLWVGLLLFIYLFL